MICWFLYLLLLVGFSQSVQNKHHLDAQKSDVETKILLLNSAGSASFPHGGCPQDLGPYTDCFDRRLTNFGCYCFVKTQRNWKQSTDFCRSNAMELVSVESRAEDYLLKQLSDAVLGFSPRYWSSGFKINGNWIWTGTSRRIEENTYTNWDSGEPNGIDLMDNSLLLDYSDDLPFWYDIDSRRIMWSICEG